MVEERADFMGVLKFQMATSYFAIWQTLIELILSWAMARS